MTRKSVLPVSSFSGRGGNQRAAKGGKADRDSSKSVDPIRRAKKKAYRSMLNRLFEEVGRRHVLFLGERASHYSER